LLTTLPAGGERVAGIGDRLAKSNLPQRRERAIQQAATLSAAPMPPAIGETGWPVHEREMAAGSAAAAHRAPSPDRLPRHLRLC